MSVCEPGAPIALLRLAPETTTRLGVANPQVPTTHSALVPAFTHTPPDGVAMLVRAGALKCDKPSKLLTSEIVCLHAANRSR
jgi:hypothetical protein